MPPVTIGSSPTVLFLLYLLCSSFVILSVGDGKKLTSVGLDDDHCIVVWDWKKGEKLASTRGHKDNIFLLMWNPNAADQMVTVGVKHIKFWTQTGTVQPLLCILTLDSEGVRDMSYQLCQWRGK